MVIFKVFCTLMLFMNTCSNIYASAGSKEMRIKLTPPSFKTENLKVLLEKRYSCRSFQTKPLSLEDVATILWATSGKKYDTITQASRTLPSAGATYPLEIYIVVGHAGIEKLKYGIYHYLIEGHSLEIISGQDKRAELAEACLGQDFIREAPVSLVIAAKFMRTTRRYGTRGERYVHMEAGGACQNAYLAVTNCGLNTVEVGAFKDEDVIKVLGLDKDCVPLGVMPIGYAK